MLPLNLQLHRKLGERVAVPEEQRRGVAAEEITVLGIARTLTFRLHELQSPNNTSR